MNVKPIRDFLVVNVEKTPETTPGGIIINPGVSEEKTVKGTVLSVGGGKLMQDGTVAPLVVKVGDTVVFNKNLAMEVKNNGEKLYVIREEQVICVVE